MIRIGIERELQGGDPFGIVSIDGVAGQTLSVEDTIIDSWCDAILEGLYRLSGGEALISIDLVDEPDPLLFVLTDGGVRLSYAGRALELGSLIELRKAALADVTAILSVMEKNTESPGMIAQIRSRMDLISQLVE